jgi:hypothetical protein
VKKVNLGDTATARGILDDVVIKVFPFSSMLDGKIDHAS